MFSNRRQAVRLRVGDLKCNLDEQSTEFLINEG